MFYPPRALTNLREVAGLQEGVRKARLGLAQMAGGHKLVSGEKTIQGQKGKTSAVEGLVASAPAPSEAFQQLAGLSLGGQGAAESRLQMAINAGIASTHRKNQTKPNKNTKEQERNDHTKNPC